MEDDKFFSINIRRLREARGWTQLVLATESGVSEHTIFRAETKGKVPDWKNIRQIANALGVAPTEMFRDVDKKPNAKPSKAETILDIIQMLPSLDETYLSRLLFDIDKHVAFGDSDGAVISNANKSTSRLKKS